MGFMKNKTKTHPTWDKLRRLKFKAPTPRHPHLTEANALKAGESAFGIRVPYYNNPYSETSLKNAWIRGFKRAERFWNESLRRSARIQETIALEEVEA
jgi:hypothetical protein